MAEVDRIPVPGATNDQIAVGINQLHKCVEDMRDEINEIKAIPGKMFRWLLLTGIGVLISQGFTLGENYLIHRDTSQKVDAVQAATTQNTINTGKIARSLGDPP